MINVGIIGLGLAARHFHIPLLNTVEGFNISTVLSSKSLEQIHSLVGDVHVIDNLTEFAQDERFDLAVVLTPNHLHFEQCQALLLAGKHVVVDKPCTVTSEQAYQLKALSIKQGLLFSVFHNRRWDSDFLTLLDLQSNNTLGQLSYVESRFDKYRPEKSTKWKDANVPGAGIHYDLLPHLADQAFQLFGYPQFVSASLAMQRERSEVCDYFNIKLIYPKLEVVLRASSLAAHSPFRFYLEGDKGTFIKQHFDIQESRLSSEPLNHHQWITEPIENSGILYNKNGNKKIKSVQGDYRYFYKNIASVLNGKDEVAVSIDDAIATIKIIELAMQSSELKKTLAW